MRSEIIFAAETIKTFAANPRRGSDYKATIQNLTAQTVTITVTNMPIQQPSPTFDTPAAGALAITAGSIGVLNEPYSGWLLTAAASTSGSVHIIEAG